MKMKRFLALFLCLTMLLSLLPTVASAVSSGYYLIGSFKNGEWKLENAIAMTDAPSGTDKAMLKNVELHEGDACKIVWVNDSGTIQDGCWYGRPEDNGDYVVLTTGHYRIYLNKDHRLWAERLYNVTFSLAQGSPNGCYLTVTAENQAVANDDYFLKDTVLTVTAHPAAGYVCTSIKKVGTDTPIELTNGSGTFKVGTTDVEFEATFAPTYTLSTAVVGQGMLTVDGQSSITFTNATTHTVVATPAEGYRLASLVDGENSVNLENLTYDAQTGAYTYTTFASNTKTITATFEPIPTYTIYVYNITPYGNVTATVNDEPVDISEEGEFTAAENDTVVISVEADANHRVDNLTNNEGTFSDSASLTFTMPAEDVTISSSHAVTVYPITVNTTEGGSVTTTVDPGFGGMLAFTADKAGGAETVFVNASPADGYRVSGVVVTKTEGGAAVAFDDDEHCFIMPEEAVTVTVTFEPIPPTTYQINTYGVSEDGCSVHAEIGGVEVDSAVDGAQVTIVAVPGTGYYVQSYHLGGADSSNPVVSSSTFTMPAHAVTIGAIFAKTDYTISASAANGTVTATKGGNAAAKANYGDTITLSNEAADGYHFVSYTVTNTATNAAINVDENNQFKMPAANVTVTATFTKVNYTVTVSDSIEHGSVGADKATAQIGDTVTLSATPATGYQLKAYTVTKTGDSSVVVPVTNGQFTMPAYDVTITAEFVVVDGYYLVGSMTNSNPWTNGLAPEYKLTQGDNLWYIDITLTQGDLFKVVYSDNGAVADSAWYPQYGDNYYVKETGAVRVYFKPDGSGDSAGWNNGIFRVENGFYLASSADVVNDQWVWNTHPLTLNSNGKFEIEQVFNHANGRYKIVGVFNYGGQTVWFGDGGTSGSDYNLTDAGTYKITFDREAAIAVKTADAPASNFVMAYRKNLELNGNIGINFKLVLPEGVQANEVVATFTVGDKETNIPLSGITPVDGFYTVKYEFAAKEVNQDVTLKVTVDGTPSLLNSSNEDVSADGITTSVKAMCDQYESSGMGAEVVALAQKIEDYGAYAANYFSGTALPEGTEVTTANDNTIKAKTRTKSIPTGVTPQVKLKSIYLTLESETTLNLRFEALENYDLANYTFWLDGTQLTPVGNVVKITNIAAKNLCTDYTVTVKQGETVVYTVTCSAMYYAKLVLSQADDDTVATPALKNLMRAMYLYWEAANAYFN